jgi:NO-binding membrane sensor protein with MHYT domain
MGLSYLVSVMGSFTALQLAVAIPAARTAASQWGAVTFAGAAMGGGAIWAMHFIAMLACQMDLHVSYDIGLTVLSAVIGIVSCMAGLAIASAGVFGWGKLVIAGLFMGAGVTGMHYTGMAAMLIPAEIHYDQTLVIASLAIAVVASIAALWLAFNMRGKWQMLGSALVMGVAVCGMHYTGMAAATFMPTETAVVTDGLSGAYLGMSIFGVTTVLLSAVLSISLMRPRQRELVQI